MEFKKNDFIIPSSEETVFKEKVFQIIEYQEQREFGKRGRIVVIQNITTKSTLRILESYLFQFFKPIDFKTIGSEQKDNDWMIDELSSDEYNLAESPMLSDNCPEVKKMTPIEMTKLALSQILPETKISIPEDTIDQIALARKLIRAKCKTLSVRNSRGTAYGWIDIRGSKNEWGEFTVTEEKALEELGLRYGLNCANISPENRKYYLRKWLGLPQTKGLEY
jgi:hypothetical protein